MNMKKFTLNEIKDFLDEKISQRLNEGIYFTLDNEPPGVIVGFDMEPNSVDFTFTNDTWFFKTEGGIVLFPNKPHKQAGEFLVDGPTTVGKFRPLIGATLYIYIDD